MRVDNTSSILFGTKRNSIRIVSKDQYTVGSVWIADMTHVPFGVRVLSYNRDGLKSIANATRTVLGMASVVDIGS